MGVVSGSLLVLPLMYDPSVNMCMMSAVLGRLVAGVYCIAIKECRCRSVGRVV